MKTVLLIAALTLGGATVANAAAPAASSGVPLCSRTVTDECMNPSQAPKAMKHHATRHHAHHKMQTAVAPKAADEK